MDVLLIAAAAVAFSTGVLHSWLGEKFILIRLFRRDLPKLFGSDWFTKRTLRFGWHVTSIAWFGFGAILLVLAGSPDAELRPTVLRWIAAAFAASAVCSAGFTRGRHLSWALFIAIAVLSWLAAG